MLNQAGDAYDAGVRYYTNDYGAFGHWGNTADWRTAYRIWTIAFQDTAQVPFFNAASIAAFTNANSNQPQHLKNLTEIVYRAFSLYLNTRQYMNARAEKAQLKRVLGSPPRQDIHEILKGGYKTEYGTAHLTLTELKSSASTAEPSSTMSSSSTANTMF